MISHPILACTICGYHSPENTSDAAGYSIFFLLIVILLILGSVIFFMVRVMRRERDNLDPELQDDYVPAPPASR
jgi:hypothetical protein